MIPTEFICYAATYARSGTYNSVQDTNQPNMKVDLQSNVRRLGEAYENYERNGHVYNSIFSILTFQIA